MNNEDILLELNTIFREVLDNDSIVLTKNTSAKDVEEWDSLTNIELIVAMEKRFNFRFSTGEIEDWRIVGDMCNTIEQKLTR